MQLNSCNIFQIHIYEVKCPIGRRKSWKKSIIKFYPLPWGLLILSMLVVGRETGKYVNGMNLHIEEGKQCVVIDAGHGGFDPGKIGINKALERGLNLQIVLKLKEFLEANDISIVMT